MQRRNYDRPRKPLLFQTQRMTPAMGSKPVEDRALRWRKTGQLRVTVRLRFLHAQLAMRVQRRLIHQY